MVHRPITNPTNTMSIKFIKYPPPL